VQQKAYWIFHLTYFYVPAVPRKNEKETYQRSQWSISKSDSK